MDNWYNDFPLSLYFSMVYAKIKSSIVSLREVWNEGIIKLNLTRGASVPYDKKSLKLFLSFTHCHSPTSVTPLFGYGNLMIFIQLSLCITFYVLEGLKRICLIWFGF
jgi:hypothetical protein